jgi:glycosyltransferase involved in cell wall biosynthesis
MIDFVTATLGSPSGDHSSGPVSRRILMLSPDCHVIDRRILQEARSLAREGYRVAVLSGFECSEEEHYTEQGVEVHRYQYDWDDERIKGVRTRIRNERLRLAFHRLFMAFARRCLEFNSFETFILSKAKQFRADIVHVHDLPFLRIAARLAAAWDAPLVFDAHEIYYVHHSIPRGRRKRLIRDERRFAKRASLFITVNDAIAEFFCRMHGNLNYLVLMNCADGCRDPDRAACRAELRRMARLAEGDRIVLYQGWIASERNLDTLVRSAAGFPSDAYLVVIGYGEHQKDLERIAEEEGIGDRVRFLGRIEPDRIMSLTRGADLGVIPYQPVDLNHELCSPNKFFEFVQAGVPVVAHDLVFFRNMKAQYGVVETADLSNPSRMTAAIVGLLEDAERLAEMRDACERAAGPLSWETESRKLVRAYRALLA